MGITKGPLTAGQSEGVFDGEDADAMEGITKVVKRELLPQSLGQVRYDSVGSHNPSPQYKLGVVEDGD